MYVTVNQGGQSSGEAFITLNSTKYVRDIIRDLRGSISMGNRFNVTLYPACKAELYTALYLHDKMDVPKLLVKNADILPHTIRVMEKLFDPVELKDISVVRGEGVVITFKTFEDYIHSVSKQHVRGVSNRGTVCT